MGLSSVESQRNNGRHQFRWIRLVGKRFITLVQLMQVPIGSNCAITDLWATLHPGSGPHLRAARVPRQTAPEAPVTTAHLSRASDIQSSRQPVHASLPLLSVSRALDSGTSLLHVPCSHATSLSP